MGITSILLNWTDHPSVKIELLESPIRPNSIEFFIYPKENDDCPVPNLLHLTLTQKQAITIYQTLHKRFKKSKK